MAIDRFVPQLDMGEMGGFGYMQPVQRTASAPATKAKSKAKKRRKRSAGSSRQAAVAPGYDINRGLAIMDAIVSQYPGIDPDTAAAVAGNFLYESYGLPNIYEGQNPSNAGTYVPQTGGVGIAQWTGPRRRGLMAMENPLTLDTQIKYFAQENAGPEAKAWSNVLAQPDLESATRVFTTDWERAGVPAINRRIGLAKDVAGAYYGRNAAEMQRQADLLGAMPPMPIQPMVIERPSEPMMVPQERRPVDFNEQIPPMQERIPTIGEFIGYPTAVMPLPYNRTEAYKRDVDRRMYERSGYSPAQIEQFLLQDYGAE